MNNYSCLLPSSMDMDGFSASYHPGNQTYDYNEADAIFHSEDGPKDKKYWNIDKSQNNLNDLQALVDVLYNQAGPKVYTVEFQKSQSGLRLAIACNTCGVVLSSYDPFISHNKGQKHLKKLAQDQTEENPNIGPVKLKENPAFEASTSGKLEQKICSSSFCIIGARMLYYEEYKDEKFYTCRLCHSLSRSGRYHRMSEKETYYHITDDEHKIAYLVEKYGYRTLKCESDELDDIAMDVKKKEGLISHKILFISNHGIEEYCEQRKKSSKKEDVRPKKRKSLEKLKLHTENVGTQVDPNLKDKTVSIQDFASTMRNLQMQLCKRQTEHPMMEWLLQECSLSKSFDLMSRFVIRMAQKLQAFGKAEKLQRGSSSEFYKFEKDSHALLKVAQKLQYPNLD